jgi:cyclopropane fatty-acyl-phospholipid synthase-like methyltransferase
MTQSTMDIWAQWLLHRRHGGDRERLKAALEHLYPIRDRVLTYAQIGDGGTLLDVGCGDGLIAFGALERSSTCRVVFADISQDLLDHAAALHGKRNWQTGVNFFAPLPRICLPYRMPALMPSPHVPS